MGKGRPGGNPDRPPLPPRSMLPGRPKGVPNKLTIERVEKEIRRIALIDPVTLFEKFKGRRTFTLREIHAMDADTRACIASVKVRTENLTAGDDAQDQTVEIRLWNKMDALTLLAKHFKYIEDKTTITVNITDLEERLKTGQRKNAEREKP